MFTADSLLSVPAAFSRNAFRFGISRRSALDPGADPHASVEGGFEHRHAGNGTADYALEEALSLQRQQVTPYRLA